MFGPLVTSARVLITRWIHGVASDSVKTAEFRAILRLRRHMSDHYQDAPFVNFSRLLLKARRSDTGFFFRYSTVQVVLPGRAGAQRRYNTRVQAYLQALQVVPTQLHRFEVDKLHRMFFITERCCVASQAR